MNLSEVLTVLALILTVLALILNAGALFYAGYQTKLSKESRELSQRAIDQQRRVQQMELLPLANYLFSAQRNLEEWSQDIEDTTKELESALQTRDENVLKRIAETGLTSPRGLVLKIFYENAPRWLRMTWMAGAQYYFDFKSPCGSLWSKMHGGPNWGLASLLVERGKINSHYLEELLKYIHDAVPEAYANSPASISDADFLSD